MTAAEIQAVVGFIRTWEADAPEVATPSRPGNVGGPPWLRNEDTTADPVAAEASDWRGVIRVGGVLLVALVLIGGGFVAFQRHSEPPD